MQASMTADILARATLGGTGDEPPRHEQDDLRGDVRI
jgi:hypothetical protein